MKMVRKQLGLGGRSDGSFLVESAATGGHTEGMSAMSEMIAACKQRGTDIRAHRARQVRPDDFERFDLVVGMDLSNLRNLKRVCPCEHSHKLRLLLRDYAPNCGTQEVPDPYYTGGHLGVYDLIEQGVCGLIEKEGIKV